MKEPRVLAFCCNWCSYAGADLAGVSRLQMPPNVRIIRVMCTGRIEPNFIMRAFELGTDGVMIAGCHIGDCHYINGNEKAEKRIKATEELMRLMGLDPDRLLLKWISASEGQLFADTVTEFVERLRELDGDGMEKKRLDDDDDGIEKKRLDNDDEMGEKELDDDDGMRDFEGKTNESNSTGGEGDGE